MRKALAALQEVGGRHRFIATIGRYDGLHGDAPCVLLLDVRNQATGKFMSDHLWSKSRRIVRSNIPKGTRVTFTASVRRYMRAEGEDDYTIRDVRNLTPVVD